MKKFITIASSILACAFAQAASVDWSVAGSSFTTSDGSSARARNYLILVFQDSDYATVTAALSSGDSASVASALESYTSQSGYTSTTKATGAAGSTFTTTEASGTTLTLWTVAFDATTIAEASNYLLSSASVLSDAYEAPATPSNTGSFSSSSYSGNSWTKMEAVPEPSVALMGLLGIGMLVKRRRA